MLLRGSKIGISGQLTSEFGKAEGRLCAHAVQRIVGRADQAFHPINLDHSDYQLCHLGDRMLQVALPRRLHHLSKLDQLSELLRNTIDQDSCHRDVHFSDLHVHQCHLHDKPGRPAHLHQLHVTSIYICHEANRLR